MMVVVCRNGAVANSWHEPMAFKDISLRAKQIFIKYQTQEIYMLSNRENSSWVKCAFTFQVGKSGMHPTKVQYDKLRTDELPADMQMKLLMGAL